MPAVLLASMPFWGSACSDDSDHAGTISGVTIVPLGSPTARAAFAITSKGGLPAHTPTPVAAPTDQPPKVPTAAPSIANPTVTSAAVADERPVSGRWIDVDVTNYVVRLMDGDAVVRQIAPVAVGAAIDTGAYVSTQTGLFHVNGKREELAYDAPFDTYISHWVGFDADKDNGFHSFLKDAAGNVVDASTGRVSNGCIRTGEPEAVFAFAEIGMPVLVHW
jgi:hypothetical protein